MNTYPNHPERIISVEIGGEMYFLDDETDLYKSESGKVLRDKNGRIVRNVFDRDKDFLAHTDYKGISLPVSFKPDGENWSVMSPVRLLPKGMRNRIDETQLAIKDLVRGMVYSKSNL